LAGGHRQADRTEVQLLHFVQETSSPSAAPVSTTPAAPASTPSDAANRDTAPPGAAAAASTTAAAPTSSRASRQARVRDTQAEHRGPRPEQPAADRRGAVHTGYGVFNAHPEGTFDHTSQENRLLHGRAHGRHAVPQED